MKALSRLLLLRLLQGLVLLLLLSFALFGVMAHLPGDPVDLLVASNPALSPADVTRLKKLRGLDQPFPVRWWRWLYGHHEAKAPPDPRELPAIVGVLPSPHPFVVDVALPEHGDLRLAPAAPLAIEDGKLHALLVEAGAYRLAIVVEDGDGQQTLWTLPVFVAPPRLSKLHPQDTGQEGEPIDDDRQLAGGTELDVDERTAQEKKEEAQQKKPLPAAPKLLEDDGVLGQKVIADAIVSGQPLVDEDRFTGGVLFGELGWSWATKRPVKDLLFGEPPACGDGLVQPGEACDGGPWCSGCVHVPVVGGEWLDARLAGALTGLGRLGNTLILSLPALLLSMLLSLLLGTLAGLKKGAVDVGVRAFAAVCSSVPAFFVALVLILLFAEQLQLFPSGGMQSPGIHKEGAAASFFDRCHHAVLPLSVLVVFWSGRFVRQVRSAVLQASSSDFVRTARAKGLSPLSTTLRHVLPNAALPLVTLVGLSLPSLFSGALLTETVFSWAGLGRLQYDAILQNDSYVAVVVFLLVAALVLFGSLLADVLVLLLDPRLRRPS